MSDTAAGHARDSSRSVNRAESFGIECGIVGALPMFLIVGVEIYGDITNSGAGFIAFFIGLFVCVPCLALAACSLYAGVRMAWRRSQTNASIKKSIMSIMLGLGIMGAVTSMLVAGFLGPTIGVGPNG